MNLWHCFVGLFDFVVGAVWLHVLVLLFYCIFVSWLVYFSSALSNVIEFVYSLVYSLTTVVHLIFF